MWQLKWMKLEALSLKIKEVLERRWRSHDNINTGSQPKNPELDRSVPMRARRRRAKIANLSQLHLDPYMC